ncbi:MAG: CRP-like cAMP-binding protein [Bradymonadia bacterium]|jgi:CRP-like cAMP-binding protein
MIRNALRPHPIFSEFRDWELARIEEMMKVLRIPAGTDFIVQGDQANNEAGHAFIIVAGDVRIVRKGDHGITLTEVVIGPGSIVGVVALVLEHVRTATCTAESDVRLLAVKRSQFDAIFKSDNRLAVKFKHVIARQLARDLRRANEAAAEKVDK